MRWPGVTEARQAELDALEAEVIRDTATTPSELIYSRGTMRLHHYLPQTSDVYRVPVLMVMSLVSKPYIFDLTPGQSFIEHLANCSIIHRS